MQYVLSDPPRVDNEAFNALESAFGASAFDDVEGVEVISKGLDIAMKEAFAKFRALERAGNITPSEPEVPTVRRPFPPPMTPIPTIRPPAEEEEDLTVGETPEGPLEL